MSPVAERSQSLVADVGGTNIRIALAGSDGIDNPVTWPCADYPTLGAALSRYLESVSDAQLSPRAAVAVASPVGGDRIDPTNLDWNFSVSKLQQELGLERLIVVNDFAAQSMAVPHLEPKQTRALKQGVTDPFKPYGLLGPGTGLGVGGTLKVGDRWVAIESEGGHQDLAATDSLEWSILRTLASELGHVSAERVLSGPGLVNLYRAICEIEGAPASDIDPAEVIALATESKPSPASRATAVFSSWLGGFAGDLALTLGARGGIYVGGGVVPKMGECFDPTRFNKRFLDKGRFFSYLEPIPVHLILEPYVALLGLSTILVPD